MGTLAHCYVMQFYLHISERKLPDMQVRKGLEELQAGHLKYSILQKKTIRMCPLIRTFFLVADTDCFNYPVEVVSGAKSGNYSSQVTKRCVSTVSRRAKKHRVRRS